MTYHPDLTMSFSEIPSVIKSQNESYKKIVKPSGIVNLICISMINNNNQISKDAV